MRGLTAVVVAAAVFFTVAVDVAFSSNHEKNRGEDYGHHERYESKFYGTVTKMPESGKGMWIVNNREVIVTQDTFIEEEHGRAVAGAYVEVKGSHTDNTFTAHKIEVKRAKK